MTYNIGTDTVYLGLGELSVQKAPIKIKTDLGSCVAVVLYDTVKKIGGMTHVVLPNSTGPKMFKYANYAVPELLKQMLDAGCVKKDLTCRVYGGSNKFQTYTLVSFKNLVAVARILDDLGLCPEKVDVGGKESRLITLDTVTGDIVLKILKAE